MLLYFSYMNFHSYCGLQVNGIYNWCPCLHTNGNSFHAHQLTGSAWLAHWAPGGPLGKWVSVHACLHTGSLLLRGELGMAF